MKERTETMNMTTMNIMSVAFLVAVCLVVFGIVALLWGFVKSFFIKIIDGDYFYYSIYLLISLVIGAVIHEAIHGARPSIGDRLYRV